GILAQYDEPAALLGRPADDFVANFVGRDRGYRALGFLTASGLTLGELNCVPVSSTVGAARDRIDGGWAVVVDDAKHPLGWISADRLSTVDDKATLDHDLLVSGGSLYQVDADPGSKAASLRSALDAALSSPSAQGIAVNAAGAVVGSVAAEDVLAALAAARTA